MKSLTKANKISVIKFAILLGVILFCTNFIAFDQIKPQPLHAAPLSQTSEHIWVGGGPYAVSTKTLITNGQYVYVGGNGIYRSNNDGATWNLVYTATRDCVSLVNPAPDTIYAGFSSIGIRRSVDGGSSWTPSGKGVITNVLSIANPENLTDTLWVSTSNDGLYKTIDAGFSWMQVMTNEIVYDLEFDVISPTIIYAATNQGLLRSMDDGESWSTIRAGVTYDVVITDGISETVYVASGTEGIYKSTDGGETWTKANKGLGCDNELCPMVKRLWVDPLDSQILYAGLTYQEGKNWGIYKSTDGGANWYSARRGLVQEAEVRDLLINDSDQNVIYAATARGVFRTANGGEQWNLLNNGLTPLATSLKIRDIAVDPIVQDTLYAGTNVGVYKSSDRGQTWRGLNQGLRYLDIGDLVVNPISPSTIYATARLEPNISTGDLYRSTDSGISWKAVLTDVTIAKGILALAESAPDIVYLGHAEGVYKSTDQGETWVEQGTFTETLSIAVAPSELGLVYAGTNGGGIFASTDGGATWMARNNGLNDKTVERLFVHPITSTIVYADTPSGFYQTIDGYTWTPLTNGIESVYCNGTFARTLDTQNLIYLGRSSNEDIYYTADGGTTWIILGKSPVNDITSAIAPSLNVETVYVGGAGVWRHVRRPIFNKISPDTTVVNAPANLTIEGRNFIAPISVKIGSTALLSVTLVNSSTIYASLPAQQLPIGSYDVTVSSDGQTVTSAQAFTITEAVASKQFTFIVFGATDNNLDSAFRELFNNLETEADNPNVNILVLWDHRDGPAERYHVQPDENPFLLANYSEDVNKWTLGEINTAEPAHLISFLNWARANYPAKYYAFSLVGHGGGWAPEILPAQRRSYGWSPGPGGILWDDQAEDSMATRVLGEALYWATQQGNDKIDLLYLDACLMGMSEVAYELRNIVDYLVMSENISWAKFAYDMHIAAVDNETNPKELAEKIAHNVYVSLVEQEEPPYPMTISVISSTKVSAVVNTIDGLAAALIDTLPVTDTIQNAFLSASQMDSNQDTFLDGEDTYIDQWDFAYGLSQSYPANSPVANSAHDMMNAIEEAVVIEYHTPYSLAPTLDWNLDDVKGLSLYAPLGQDNWKRRYYNSSHIKLAADTLWDEFLAAYYNHAEPPEDPSDPVDDLPVWSDTLVKITPSTGAIAPGEIITIAVTIKDVAELYGTQVRLNWDPAILELVKMTQGELFEPGEFTTDSYDNVSGTAYFAITLQGDTTPISGTGNLLYFNFEGKSLGETALELEDILLLDAQPKAIPHRVQEGGVIVALGDIVGNPRLEGRNDHSGIFATLHPSLTESVSDKEGRCQFTDLMPGTYLITYSHPLYLWQTQEITTTANFTNSAPPVTLIAGDANNDGRVDIVDLSIIGNDIGGTNLEHDINGDGMINLFEMVLVAKNLDSVAGEPPASVTQNFKTARSTMTPIATDEITEDDSLTKTVVVRGRDVQGLRGIDLRLSYAPESLAIANIEPIGIFADPSTAFIVKGSNIISNVTGYARFVVATTQQGNEITTTHAELVTLTLQVKDDMPLSLTVMEETLLSQRVEDEIIEIPNSYSHLTIEPRPIYHIYLPLMMKSDS